MSTLEVEWIKYAVEKKKKNCVKIFHKSGEMHGRRPGEGKEKWESPPPAPEIPPKTAIMTPARIGRVLIALIDSQLGQSS